MKYLICFVALGFNALTQDLIPLPPSIEINEPTLGVQHVNIENIQKITHEDQSLVLIPQVTSEQIQLQNQNDQHQRKVIEHKNDDHKHKSYNEHLRKDHNRIRSPDHNQIPYPNSLSITEQGEQIEERFKFENHQQLQHNEDYQDNLDRRHHKKFWKGKSLGHIFVLAFLAILSFCLVRRCIKKRNRQNRRNKNEIQNLSSPAKIDEQIRKHYVQIQRLTQIKATLQIQAQIEPQQIIYHQPYPQEVEMMNSNGRMINQNSYSKQNHQFIHFQNIPVGRPVLNNPYNHPQIYRTHQY